MKQSMQVLTSSNSDDWGTPPHIIDLVKEVMGTIILDPAAAQDPAYHFALANNSQGGLENFWDGDVYLNPPYSKMPKWADKAIEEWNRGEIDSMCALFKCYVGYEWFKRVCQSANAVCFLWDRLKFVPLAGQPVVGDGRAKFGSCVFYWGPDPLRFCHVFDPFGLVEILRWNNGK